LADLAHAFSGAAAEYGRIIISERYEENKTIQPVNLCVATAL